MILTERSAAFDAFLESYGQRDEDDETLADGDRELLAGLNEDERFWVGRGRFPARRLRGNFEGLALPAHGGR